MARDVDETDLELRTRVPAGARGLTLLAYLLQRFRYHDERAWRTELTAGRLSLDGSVARGGERLRTGMQITYRKRHREPVVRATHTVLHSDAHLIVVDKPAHLPMHADGPFLQNTLIQRLRSELARSDLQLIHRLDRETSGVCVIAADRTVQSIVQRQFLDGSIEKGYLAVVEGLIEAPFRVDQPIGYAAHSEVRLRRSAAADAVEPRAASTDFEPLARGPHRTLLRCRPWTGRTHQIRVHLEAAGHPVVGERLYGLPDEAYLAFVHRMKAGGSVHDSSGDAPDRHLLHAHTIRLRHPADGAPVEYVAPMPAEFERWLAAPTGTSE